jgi:hypothetical protein
VSKTSHAGQMSARIVRLMATSRMARPQSTARICMRVGADDSRVDSSAS